MNIYSGTVELILFLKTDIRIVRGQPGSTNYLNKTRRLPAIRWQRTIFQWFSDDLPKWRCQFPIATAPAFWLPLQFSVGCKFVAKQPSGLWLKTGPPVSLEQMLSSSNVTQHAISKKPLVFKWRIFLSLVGVGYLASRTNPQSILDFVHTWFQGSQDGGY